jgi:valacyclovir hydrolase
MAWFDHGTSRIYYEESGQGVPVLLIPGFSGRVEDFAELRAALSPSYRVITADPPGSGRSGPQPRDYTADYFEDDARSFAALLKHLDVGPAHLMGFSDGGEYSLLMAARTPEVARSVVTWGASGGISDPTGQLREATAHVVDDPPPPLKGWRDYLVSTYGEENARVMTQSLERALTGIIDRGGDISLSLADRITCPALIIVGDNDFFLPFDLAIRLTSRLPKGVPLKAVGAGHDVHHAQPAWLAQTILNWLKEH